jgi:hypothetical protein
MAISTARLPVRTTEEEEEIRRPFQITSDKRLKSGATICGFVELPISMFVLFSALKTDSRCEDASSSLESVLT